MSSSDLAVETELVHFVGVIQDTTAHETSPLHFSRQNQTVPSRQIASVYFCVGERANTVRVQHAVPLERTRGDHRNAQLRLVLIAPEPRQQLRHAKVRVLRPPGGTVVRCIKLCDATTRFRWHSSPCKETPHTLQYTHTTRRCVASANPQSTTVSAWTSSCLCALEPRRLLLDFGKSWGDAPSSTPTTPSAAKAGLL